MDPKTIDIIRSRRSIRRYRKEKLDAATMNHICHLNQNIEPFIKNNKFFLKVEDYSPRGKIGKTVGGFGRIMTPPHVFLPYLTGSDYILTDLGFRTQQIVLELWKMGIGSCYIGCIHKQNRVRKDLNLPSDCAIAAFVFFGKPGEDQSLRIYQKISYLWPRSHERLSGEQLFLDTSWKEIRKRHPDLSKIIDVGRLAPSAVNAQPWRFVIFDNRFIICAKLRKHGSIYDLDQEYALHDVGICMANLDQAAKLLGYSLKWQPLTDFGQIGKDDCMIPVAEFSLDNIGRLI